MLIIIEGVDGSGKSGLCDSLADEMGAKVVHSSNCTPSLPGMLNEMRSDIGVYAPFHFMHYIEAAAGYMGEVKSCLARGIDVILDRYIYSTRVTHKVFDSLYGGGRHVGQMDRLSDIAESALPIPDLVVLVTIGDKERRERLLLRKGNNSIDDDPRLISAFREGFREDLKRLARKGMTTIEVDNSGRFGDTKAEIRRVIEEARPKNTMRVRV